MRYIIIALFSFLLVSCDKDDNGETKIKNANLKLQELTSKPFKDL